jgi:hypothetical protein
MWSHIGKENFESSKFWQREDVDLFALFDGSHTPGLRDLIRSEQ